MEIGRMSTFLGNARTPTSQVQKRIKLTVIVGGMIVASWAANNDGLIHRAMAQGNPRGPAAAAPTQPGAAQASRPGQARPGESTTIDVVAMVNGQQLTRQHLAQECLRRFGRTVLESIINKQLILNECARVGIVITEQDVDEEIERRAKRFGLSGDRYLALIQSQRNITPDKLKSDIIWMELALRRLAANRIQVSPQEIAERMEAEYGAKVQVRAIALTTQQEADEILAYLRQHPDQFGRMAKDRSADPHSAAVRGLLPPIRRHMGEPRLENAAFALAEGAISEVLALEGQYLILMCERHFPAMTLPPDQIELAQQKVADQLREAKLGDAAADLFRRLQESARITNVWNDPQLRQQMPGVAAIINDQQISMRQLSEECIARFGHDVLDAEINRMVLLQQLQRHNLTVSQEDVQGEVGRAAYDYGFLAADGKPDFERWLAYVSQNDAANVEIYIQDEVWPSVAMKKLVESRVQVSREDLQMGFEANFGPRVECLAIVLSDQRSAQRVWQMAMSNPTEKYFGELANQYSAEPASKANFGQVPPIQKHGGRPTLEDEAFRLKPGEVSGLINVGEYWVILYCQGRTTPVVQDFDAVKGELQRDIHEKKLRIAMAEEFDRLRQTAQIDNFLAGTSQSGTNATPTTGQLPFRGEPNRR